MEIYLVRHTAPNVPANTCYGQTNVGILQGYEKELPGIRKNLPENAAVIWCSPLLRCRILAEKLYAYNKVFCDDALKEIDCGEWEMKLWSEIPTERLRHWMENFKTVAYPNGENYTMLESRVTNFIQKNLLPDRSPVVIVTHAGVMRCILSLLMQISIDEVLKQYHLAYGCVVKIRVNGER